MIKKLTKKQEALIPVVRDEWLNRFFSLPKIDKVKVEKSVKWLYKFSNLEKPLVVFLDSPFACQVKANELSKPDLQINSQIFSQIESQVRSQVHSQVESHVYSHVHSRIHSQVHSQVESQVESHVHSRIYSQVRSQVHSQVESHVHSQVESQVRSQVDLKYFDFSAYGSIWDYGWVAYYDYFTRIGAIEGHENFNKFMDYLKTGIYDCIQFDGLCLVCGNPGFVNRDEQNRMHCLTGAAVGWRDGYEQHHIHGVFFEPELHKKVSSGKMKFKQIMKLKNIEQRMVALKLVGPEQLLKDAKARLIDTSERGNELYLVKDVFDIPAYFLKYTCPSTGRIYVSGVSPDVGIDGNADECMAWKFGLDLNEYNQLVCES